MSSQEEQANIGRVLSFLREWDRGDRTVRGRMLNTFLTHNTGKTCYELELEFAQVASLFLARLTTWMRLTYMFGTFLGLQLKAIGIFLSASSPDQYLMEFLEDGGVLTLLEILSQSKSKEEEKAEALRLLLTVSNAGRVKAVAACMAKSSTDETQETACVLLESLSHGNPKYQNQIYKSLIALMTCTSPKAQQLVLHALHTVQSKMKTAHHSIVEPLLNMLRSLHLEVQGEAINLILDLKCYDVRPILLSGLVTLLRPTKEDIQQHQNMEESEIIKTTGSLPVFVQQAAAAKIIRLFQRETEVVLLSLNPPDSLDKNSNFTSQNKGVGGLQLPRLGVWWGLERAIQLQFPVGKGCRMAKDSCLLLQTGGIPTTIYYSLLAEDSQEVSRELLSLGVIQHLLYTMGNREHTDAQIQASLALEHFVRSYPVIEEHVQRVMGSTLFAAFMHNADTLYMSMDETQAEILLTNKVNITEVLDGDKL